MNLTLESAKEAALRVEREAAEQIRLNRHKLSEQQFAAAVILGAPTIEHVTCWTSGNLHYTQTTWSIAT